VLVAGAENFVDDIAIGGEEDEAIGGFVEAADGEDALGVVYVIDNVAGDVALGGARNANGFVEGQIHELAGRGFLNGLAVEQHRVACSDPIAGTGYLPVEEYPAGFDEAVGFAARAAAGAADELVEAYGFVVRHGGRGFVLGTKQFAHSSQVAVEVQQVAVAGAFYQNELIGIFQGRFQATGNGERHHKIAVAMENSNRRAGAAQVFHIEKAEAKAEPFGQKGEVGIEEVFHAGKGRFQYELTNGVSGSQVAGEGAAQRATVEGDVLGRIVLPYEGIGSVGIRVHIGLVFGPPAFAKAPVVDAEVVVVVLAEEGVVMPPAFEAAGIAVEVEHHAFGIGGFEPEAVNVPVARRLEPYLFEVAAELESVIRRQAAGPKDKQMLEVGGEQVSQQQQQYEQECSTKNQISQGKGVKHSASALYKNQFFLFEEGIGKELVNREALEVFRGVQGFHFGIQAAAAFPGPEAVGVGVALLVGNESARPLQQLARFGHRAGNHQVEALFLDVFYADMPCIDIFEAQGFGHSLYHFDFFSGAIHQHELHLRVEDGQGDAGKAAAGTEVEHPAAGTDGHNFGQGQGVEQVAGVEIFDVFSGNDIDALIPLAVKGLELGELLQLRGAKVWKILQEWLHRGKNPFREHVFNV
jgi:hypothetical protein